MGAGEVTADRCPCIVECQYTREQALACKDSRCIRYSVDDVLRRKILRAVNVIEFWRYSQAAAAPASETLQTLVALLHQVDARLASGAFLEPVVEELRAYHALFAAGPDTVPITCDDVERWLGILELLPIAPSATDGLVAELRKSMRDREALGVTVIPHLQLREWLTRLEAAR
jgi:hypothetical protein